MPPDQFNDRSVSSTARRALVIAAVASGVIVALLLLWKAATVFLLGFAAVLIAIFFQGAAYSIQARTPLPYWASVALVLAVTVSAIAIAGWFAAPAIADQTEELRQQLPQSVEQLHQTLRQQRWGRALLRSVPDAKFLIAGGQNAISKFTTVFSTVFEAIGYIIFVLFLFVFVAFQPRLYRRGIELLVPVAHRRRACALLDEIWGTLWWWLAARAAAMAAVGVMTAVGLMLLGVPLALTLGLIAALLDFVPNFGPIVAAIPALLLATMQGPQTVIYVALLYSAIQMAEGNIITPLAQKKAIDMAPALVIASQFVLGTVFGIVGFIVATPLVAVVLVVVRSLYVEQEERRTSTAEVDRRRPDPTVHG